MTYKRYKICIVCEGEEEFDYLNRLIQLNVFSKIYEIKLDNAHSITQIAPRYQFWYYKDNHDLVLAFCDTEMAPYEQFNKIKEDLSKIFGSEKAVKKVLFYANPCTMQIILSHFKDIKLKSNQKRENGAIINELTHVKNYSAKKSQRNAIMKKLNTKNYGTLKKNLSKLNTEETVVSSTNFLTLLNYLESDNPQWIKDIKQEVDKY